MRDTEFAYGVAHIRAHELSLLTNDNLESMISASNLNEAIRVLGDKGWNTESRDFSSMLLEESEKNWNLLCECLPEEHLLDCLIIENDFHNLKTAIKTVFTGEDPELYFVFPCVYDTQKMKEAINKKDFSSLPECMAETAEKAYDVLTRLGSGQMADIIIDKQAMAVKLQMAEKSDSALLKNAVAMNVAAANIKIALRCIKTSKSIDFMKKAMSDECPIIDIETLQKKALEGENAVTSYLEGIKEFSLAASFLKESSTLFEKCLDDAIMEKVKDAKYTAFGVEPIFAYYMAREAEIKNVRVILSLKRNGISSEEIRKRVREAYV